MGKIKTEIITLLKPNNKEEQYNKLIKEENELKCIISKLRHQIIPICFTIVFLNYIDRTNLSLGARELLYDLNLSQEQYGKAVSSFFISYAFFQIPSNLILEHVGPRIWIGIIITTWGLVATSMSAISSPTHFYIARFILGIAESGTFPALWYYLTLFFPERYIALSLALMNLGSNFALVIAGPMAASLLALDNIAGFKGWQWLFFMEGFPSILMGLYVFKYLPLSIDHVKFLSKGEKQVLKRNMNVSKDDKIDIKEKFKRMLTNKNLWIISIAMATIKASVEPTIYWMPLWINSLLQGHGLSIKESTMGSNQKDIFVALLTSIPYICATLSMYFIAWHSELKNERKYHIIITCFISTFIFITLPLTIHYSIILSFVPLISLMFSYGGASGPILGLMNSYLVPETKAIGLAFFNSMSNFGGFLGSLAFGHFIQYVSNFNLHIVLASFIIILGTSLFLFLPDNVSYHRQEKNSKLNCLA